MVFTPAQADAQETNMTDVIDKIGVQLRETEYACSSLSLLSGDTTNLVFRGQLLSPLAGGNKTIIIKYHMGHIPSNPNFKLDISRSMVERAMLSELESLSPVREGRVTTRTPCVYSLACSSTVVLLEDLAGAMDIKSALSAINGTELLVLSDLRRLGRALGSWLRIFHAWASDKAGLASRQLESENKPMRSLRYQISYGAFIDIVKKFPQLWTQYGQELKAVREMASAEYCRTTVDDAEQSWGVIHGDFWTGNVLMSKDESCLKGKEVDISMFVTDWEFTQFGRREYDLGQIMGDLYERAHFGRGKEALAILEEFSVGYGSISNEMAFRVAIHAGVHMICWYIRRDPTTPFTEAPEEIEEAIRVGTEMVVHGWRKDINSLSSGALACLFL